MGMLAVNGMLGKVLGGMVGNLFIIFFQNPRVKFALFFDAIRNNLAQKLEGTKAFKLNIFQEMFGF